MPENASGSGNDREAHGQGSLRAALLTAFGSADSPEALISGAARLLGEYLGVDCVGFSEVDATGEVFSVSHEWTLRDVSVLGRHRLGDFGSDMVDSLRAGRVMSVENVAEAAEAAQYLHAFQSQGFEAFVAAPVLKRGRLTGTFFVLSRQPRTWGQNDIYLIAEVGERIWSALDRQRAVAARLDSEDQLQLALLAASAGTFEIAPDSDAVPVVSEGARALFGFGASETAGVDDFIARVHPKDRNRVTAAIAQSIAGKTGHEIEYRVVWPDGQTVWVASRAAYSAAGDGKGLLRGVIIDVSQRKAGEEALRRERKLLRTIIDSIPVMLTLYDPDVNVLMLNREFERLTGWNAEDAAKVAIMEEIYPDPTYRNTVQRFMNAASGWMDIEMRTRSGAVLQSSWANVVLDDGRRVGIGLDSTERKQAEQQREFLIAELDHRVKNTLALVQALARQSFRHHPETTPARRAFEGRLKALAAAHDLLTEASWHVTRMTRLVDMVIAAATPRPGAVEVEGSEMMLTPKQAVTMAMVLHELTTNALKYGALSVDGGQVSLSWQCDAGETFRLCWAERGGPRLPSPPAKGFGLTMIERSLDVDFDGSVSMAFGSDGLTLQITGRIGDTGSDSG
jgi:PAS domain S-box-containing protein